MLDVVRGDIFAGGPGGGFDVLVNPVNCVGVMGAGIAKEFRRRWPDMFEAYRLACRGGLVAPGRLFVHCPARPDPVIVCLPTKRHWRDRSNLPDVDAGLAALARYLKNGNVRVGLPAVGCGLGGLPFAPVAAAARQHLAGVRARVTLFEF